MEISISGSNIVPFEISLRKETDSASSYANPSWKYTSVSHKYIEFVAPFYLLSHNVNTNILDVKFDIDVASPPSGTLNIECAKLAVWPI